VAEGEADCSVLSEEDLDELVEVELDLPSSWGCRGRGSRAATARGFTNRRHNADLAVIITVLLLRAEGHNQWPAGFFTGLS
jgi:hypothetical protein